MRPYTKNDDPKRCPVCGKSKTEYGKPWASVFHHVTAMARTELFEREFNPAKKKPAAPHVEYLHKRTDILATTKMIITVRTKRRW